MGSASEPAPLEPPKVASQRPSRPAVQEEFGPVQDSDALLATLVSGLVARGELARAMAVLAAYSEGPAVQRPAETPGNVVDAVERFAKKKQD